MVRKAFACNWHTSYPLNFMANQTAEGCREAGQSDTGQRMTVNNPPLGKGDKTCYQKYNLADLSAICPHSNTQEQRRGEG